MDTLVVYYKVPQELQSRFQDEAWDAVTFRMSATSFAELDDASQEIIPLRLLSVFSGTPLHLFALAAFFQFGFGHFFRCCFGASLGGAGCRRRRQSGFCFVVQSFPTQGGLALDSLAVQSFSEGT